MPRAILLVLDSVGCGAAPDAALYGDLGADTLGHIAEACAEGRGDRAGLRAGVLNLPNLCALGLGAACEAATGRIRPGLPVAPDGASFGYAVERSSGKDTPSGHWEMAGTPVRFAWGTFPRTVPAFPASLTDALQEQAGLPGILGNCHASGTDIVRQWGADHLRSGRPICYTSVDSVFQIAAHEQAFGLERLMDVCRVARRLCDPLTIGRVIARPFEGWDAATFRRTANRKDFAVLPPSGTLLERAAAAQRPVVTIGKIGDIFAHRFTGAERKGASNDANVSHLLGSMGTLPDGGLIVANLVDFDSEFGHRRDVPGYAACLEAFDRRLPTVLAAVRRDDLLVITADHGNDPTWPGSDHTRETVPVLAFAPGRGRMNVGRRESLSDIGATLADHLGLAQPAEGQSWL